MLTQLCRRVMAVISSVLQRVFQREPAPAALSGPAAVLAAVRAEIDQLDRRLFDLLRERMRLVQRARAAKAQLGRGIVDLAREQAMLDERRAWAVAHDLDAEDVARVFEAVVLLSRRAQERCGGEADARRKARGR